MSNGIAAAAASDQSETYFQYAATNAKRASAATAAGAQSARKTPRAVATPFPPLKLSQMGKQCPNNTARPAIIIQVALSWEYRAASQTAAEPFAVSSTKVKMPAAGPATRVTFAAPILPLPEVRISLLPKILVIKIPHGMEPSRYAVTTIPRSVRGIPNIILISRSRSHERERLNLGVYGPGGQGSTLHKMKFTDADGSKITFREVALAMTSVFTYSFVNLP